MKNRNFFLIVLLITIVLFSVGQVPSSALTEPSPWTRQLKKYSNILSLIKAIYPEPVREKKLVFASISDFLKGLDPHSYFLDPDAQRTLDEEQQGMYYGIGTQIIKFEKRLAVVAVIENSPAQQHGIKPGDIIVSIDGKNTDELSENESLMRIRGHKSSIVSLLIKREGILAPIRFNIKRKEIPLKSIPYAIQLPQDPRIGYIGILSFGNTTADELKKTLNILLKEKKVKAVIIDLRWNSGGSLFAAVEAADFFLPKGKTIVSIRGRNEEKEFKAEKNHQYENLNIAILINRGSASASEILAASLQDHKRAKLYGTRSWGKGLVQTVTRLPFDTAIALTTAKYYTPSNKCVQRDYSHLDDYYFFLKNKNYDSDRSIKGGVIPDVFVPSEIYPDNVYPLFKNGTFFDFSCFLIRQDEKLSPLFRADESTLNAFKKYLNEKKVKYNEAIFNENSNFICREITRESLSLKFSILEGMKAFLESDPVTQSAVQDLKKNIENNLKNKYE